ncbi:RlmE family RNA methyltransferase [Maritalea mediterranea]|uniref:Ribosomal RNA large subunit methyltransferase E n=1 Tax=Maritalea mediterranea TaxID=2909667 RepID=A0ABS9E5B4_9HYPH|nr:RlmE family RNA methyltransferase [Maritalea mediterranea]MCF4098052.1 RlmE family RNA methyltransferase [Maritalea mediterranea]
MSKKPNKPGGGGKKARGKAIAKAAGKAKSKASDRSLKTRVKTAKGRKISSTLWLQRQLNDPYVQRAKKEGRRSRAAYKLIELNEKHNILRPGMRVVDLGCAPGGWCEVATEIMGADADDPKIVGIDYLEMEPMPGVIFLQKDFNDDDAPEMLIDALGGHKVDLVLSDMAAPTTGHKATDHLRIMALVELAADFAIQILKPDGAFVAKVFQGGTENELLAHLKRHFKSTFHAKPPASRQDSSESYLIAKGFKGKQD